MKSKVLSSGLEDYLETIYIAHINKTPLKGVELARAMNISRASVSEALSKLVAKGLIKYNSYETISITSDGIKAANEIYNKHNILESFFQKVLLVNKKEAGENACKIEHIISKDILNKMTEFIKFYDENKEFFESRKINK